MRRGSKELKNVFFFQTGTIRSEVSSLLSVFSRLFYADAHVGVGGFFGFLTCFSPDARHDIPTEC
jgi:hypothetical protein